MGQTQEKYIELGLHIVHTGDVLVGVKDEREREEVRKIQFSGKSSFVLALPKKWVQDMGLKAGDQVSVSRRGDASLVVSPRPGTLKGTKSEATLTVGASESPASLARRLISVYLLGYSSIHVVGKGGTLATKHREAAKDAMRRHLVGTEIMAESAGEVTLQVLLSYPELDVKSVVKRMFLIAVSMHRDSLTALRTLNRALSASVVKTDDEVDRFSLYGIRQLNIAVESELVLKEVGLNTRRDCLDYRLIIKIVERVADHASKIAQGITLLDVPPPPVVMEKLKGMSDFAVGLFEDSGLSLFKGAYADADRVVERAKQAANMQKGLVSTLERSHADAQSQTISLMVEDLRRTADYAADVAEVVINMATEHAVGNPDQR
jgi:phosphate uptake regulator